MAERRDWMEIGRKIADMLRSAPRAATAALKAANPVGEGHLSGNPGEPPQSDDRREGIFP